MSEEKFFSRLTRLFRSGPVVKRKVRNAKKPSVTKVLDNFRKANNDIYNNVISDYGAYDRMSRYADFSEMEYCLHGDTLIATPNGYETIKELSEKYSHDESFIVYAYDHNKKQIVPALGKQARQTRFDHAYKVTFDSGKEIIGTANHKLMLRDGTYKRIDQLAENDSMMPFYRKDFFAKDKNDNKSPGYRWIYTMDYDNSTLKNGWIAEHRLIASWIAGRKLLNNEVVHHKNFIKYDNNPENLHIMTDTEHAKYHQIILNGKKWDYTNNSDWIDSFKKQHSEFMKNNNPAERKDITFSKILEICENYGFNSKIVCSMLDTDINVIKRRLRRNGFENFELFAKTYDINWKNNGWNNSGKNNPRYDHSLSFQHICDTYDGSQTLVQLSDFLDTTPIKILNRLKNNGFKNYTDFKENYANHKVVSVEYYGEIPLYDLTVDGYKNFATDSVISHNTPEISAALDIYADETVSTDDKGRSLHVFSENYKIKKILEELFYDTLNTEFNLRGWIRNLCKYGDFFLFNDVHPDYGVLNAYPIPVNEINREEGYDPEEPMGVRYRWVTNGNAELENWQVTHMRLLGNDAFLPYGSSIIEPARRIWRQLVLIEDAMLVYRVVRSPERRVFYIDVGAVPPEDIPHYMEQAKTTLRANQVIDKSTGKVDLRYNPLSVDEDYFIPVRGGESGTRVDTLAGGTNVSAIEDVEYIQKKLFAALKVPRAYLGYDETLSSKATLAQEDIRFSRTINYIQKVAISELNKLAIIHLYANGFDGDDLLDFNLTLSNPSAIAQQQKLELYRTKFEIAGSAPEGLVSRPYLLKNIIGLTDKEIELQDYEKIEDKLKTLELENIQLPGAEGDEGGEPTDDTGGEESEDEEDAGDDLFSSNIKTGKVLETDDDTNDDAILSKDIDEPSNKPVNVNNHLQKTLYNRSRRRTHGASKTHMPKFSDMLSHKNDSFSYKNAVGASSVMKFNESKKSNDFYDLKLEEAFKLSSDVEKILKKFKDFKSNNVDNVDSAQELLIESDESDI